MPPNPACRESMEDARRWRCGYELCDGTCAFFVDCYRRETRSILSRLRALRAEERERLGLKAPERK